ncbi:hypothetical protein E8E14_009473, partial [Neopestalotiopsis sp. 37M]
MLCHQCRRAATRAVRQLASATRAQTPAAPVRATHTASWKAATPLSSIQRQTASAWSTRQYSTSSSETPAAAASPSPSATSSSSNAPEKPDYLDAAESEIWDKLTAEFAPTELMVQDVSGGCGSMYGIEIASEKFRGTNMLKQQRMVNAVLGEQMK